MLEFHDAIPPIPSSTCTGLLAQEYWYRGELSDEASVIFLRLEGERWHRFFIDVGVVFWKRVDAPNPPSTCGDEGEFVYKLIDIGTRHALTGKQLQGVQAVDLPHGGELRLRFVGGQTLVLRNIDDCSQLILESGSEDPT